MVADTDGLLFQGDTPKQTTFVGSNPEERKQKRPHVQCQRHSANTLLQPGVLRVRQQQHHVPVHLMVLAMTPKMRSSATSGSRSACTECFDDKYVKMQALGTLRQLEWVHIENGPPTPPRWPYCESTSVKAAI